jgi:hypothetical protein
MSATYRQSRIGSVPAKVVPLRNKANRTTTPSTSINTEQPQRRHVIQRFSSRGDSRTLLPIYPCPRHRSIFDVCHLAHRSLLTIPPHGHQSRPAHFFAATVRAVVCAFSCPAAGIMLTHPITATTKAFRAPQISGLIVAPVPTLQQVRGGRVPTIPKEREPISPVNMIALAPLDASSLQTGISDKKVLCNLKNNVVSSNVVQRNGRKERTRPATGDF